MNFIIKNARSSISHFWIIVKCIPSSLNRTHCHICFHTSTRQKLNIYIYYHLIGLKKDNIYLSKAENLCDVEDLLNFRYILLSNKIWGKKFYIRVKKNENVHRFALFERERSMDIDNYFFFKGCLFNILFLGQKKSIDWKSTPNCIYVLIYKNFTYIE